MSLLRLINAGQSKSAHTAPLLRGSHTGGDRACVQVAARGAAVEAADCMGPRRPPAGSVLQAGPAGALQEEAGSVRLLQGCPSSGEPREAGRERREGSAFGRSVLEAETHRSGRGGRGGHRESGQRCWGPGGAVTWGHRRGRRHLVTRWGKGGGEESTAVCRPLPSQWGCLLGSRVGRSECLRLLSQLISTHFFHRCWMNVNGFL